MTIQREGRITGNVAPTFQDIETACLNEETARQDGMQGGVTTGLEPEEVERRIEDFLFARRHPRWERGHCCDNNHLTVLIGEAYLLRMQEGLNWVSERALRRKIGLPLTSWEAYAETEWNAALASSEGVHFSIGFFIFVLYFSGAYCVYAALCSSMEWAVHQVKACVVEITMIFCLLCFEARHGCEKTVFLTLVPLGTTTLAALPACDMSQALSLTDCLIRISFVILGLVHADLLVNFDLVVMGRSWFSASRMVLFLVFLDLGLIPKLVAWTQETDVSILWWVAYLHGFSFALNYVPHMKSTVIGPPSRLMRVVLKVARVVFPAAALACTHSLCRG